MARLSRGDCWRGAHETHPALVRGEAVVWIGTSEEPAPTETLECISLLDAIHRAGTAAPRSCSLMLPASAFARAQKSPRSCVLSRAHRIILCPQTATARLAGCPAARLGVLPRPFDVEAFAQAISWLSVTPPPATRSGRAYARLRGNGSRTLTPDPRHRSRRQAGSLEHLPARPRARDPRHRARAGG